MSVREYWYREWWTVIEDVIESFDYDTSEDRKPLEQFFTSLSVLLPCERCRFHYRTILQRCPIRQFTRSKSSMLIWVSYLKKEISASKSSTTHSKRRVNKRCITCKKT